VLPVPSLEHSAQLTSIVVIPARYESTRFPGKALALIAGRPMIEHVYERAARARGITRVLVATDDDRIARAVERFGGQAVMTSAAHATGTDRLAEVAARIECDVIVNVQGDEPLVEPTMIEQAIAPFRDDPELLMTSLRARIVDAAELADPNVVKVVVDRQDFALYFSRAPIPFTRDAAAVTAVGPHFSAANPGPTDQPPLKLRRSAEALAKAEVGPYCGWRHVGLYGYRRAFLPAFAALPPSPLEQTERLEQLRALEHGVRIKVLETPHFSIGVDTPADLAKVDALLASGVDADVPMTHGT
jgi:3-deoxy-manno-octulosonate cytidylyltransferase (CMP-KDO synthetase)